MTSLACIIPAHNPGALLQRSAASALAQDCISQVVLVDDASTDGSVQAFVEGPGAAAQRAGRLMLVRLASNHGPGAARNIGVAATQSDTLCFLDQDDECLPGAHALCLAVLEANPLLGAVTGALELWRDGAPALAPEDPRLSAIQASVPWNLLMRRTTFWACGGFPVGAQFRTAYAGEDIALRNTLSYAFALAHAEVPLVRHHVYAGSHTDRYLARTRPHGERIEFPQGHQAELESGVGAAVLAHVARTRGQFDDLRYRINALKAQ
ncbi:MAG: glycosyltransferase family A protein [Burkholderiaceae bacterium]|nr:glycosyltransferase family A protein [Burkholderiaceae bacterium]MDO9089374.1 glycosyltransferase family A protein [Burkholderiaceae bacterium]MDP1968812.1 glycosyltransferase family A protein [Burkholderiaceae bacterium]